MTAAIVRCVGILVCALVCCGALSGTGYAQQPEDQQKVFRPLDQLPPAEELPAGRLLVAAYSFVLVAVLLYVVSVGRRLTTVQREIERLESDVKRTGRT